MFSNYLKTAYRTFLRDKTYPALGVTGLSLGITCGLLLFLFVEFHLSTDGFHAGADRIYRVVLDIHSTDGTVEHEPGSSLPMAKALAQEYPQIEKTAFCMFLGGSPTLSPLQPDQPPARFLETAGIAYGTAGLLDMFSYEFIAGNRATALSTPNSVVLTEGKALKYFGRKEVLGSIIRINNRVDLTVTGVVKNQRPNTDLKVDVLLSLPTLKVLNPGFETDNFGWVTSTYWTFVQLREGYDYRQLDGQLPGFVAKYMKDFSHWHLHLQPLREMHFDMRYGGYLRKPMLLALAVVGLLLVGVAAINFVNLSTAQSLRRAKEVGVRKVMGGTGKQIFWQFLTETALLTVVATLLSLLLAAILLPTLRNWLQTPIALNLTQNPSLLLLLIGLPVAVTFLAGSYPALVLAGFQPVKVLKSNLTPRTGGFSLRHLLVGTQLVVSQVFITGALVVMGQMEYFRSKDMGFDRETILLLKTTKTEKSREQVRNELLRLPEVKQVSFQVHPPATSANDGGHIKYNHRPAYEPFLVRDRWGDANYLDLYGLTLVAGRNLVERDSVTEFIVNQELVRRLGLSRPEDIIGRALFNGNAVLEGTIVGVVKDFHQNSLHHAVEPLVIYSFPRIQGNVGVKLQTQNLPAALQKIRAVWQEAYPEQVFAYEFLDENLAKLYQKEAVLLQLSRLFTGVTILICCLGFFGLVRFMASRRTKEIGIRKVLGASLGDILLLFGKEFLVLLLLSLLVAAPLASWIMSQWLAGFAYRISVGWQVLGLTGLLSLLIIVLTTGYQAVAAALADPVKSIQSE
jgi:putative ABC transport system permease protein